MSPACRASNGAIPPVWWRQSPAGMSRTGPRARRGTQAASALTAVSHAIRLGELSTVSTNVAIPTIWTRGATQCRGNCMRHSWISSPGGSHVLPLIAPPVAQPLEQPVAQPVAHQWRASGLARWPGTVNTARATTCPHHHDGSRGHTQTPHETSTSNIDCPAPASRKVTTQPTRFVP